MDRSGGRSSCARDRGGTPPLRRLSATLTLSAALAGASLAHAQPRPTPPHGEILYIDIPAQDASEALVRLCLAAGCDLAFTPASGRAVRTRAVRGQMSWRSALAQMSEGTTLRYRFVGARGVRVWVAAEAPALPAGADGPVEVRPLVVTGRFSDQIDAALAAKRAADTISDGVSVDRLGDLPAANLAEALQRAPGVAIEREVGEGQFVSVRGLGPLFQSVTVNGAPVAFNENIRNSTQSGRQFRFRALSVDLLSGARLTKSATADLIAGGIGSNIDIETSGGLEGSPFISLRLGGEINDRAAALSPDFALAGRLISTAGDLGLVLGVAQEARSIRYDRFQIMRYGETRVDGVLLATPNDVRMTVEQEERLRRSLFLGGDWRPSADFSLDFDALVSTFDNTIREDRLVFGLGERLARPGAVTQVRDGVVTAGSIEAGRIDNNTEFSDQAHVNLLASLGAEMGFRGWRLAPRISLSSATSVLDTPLQRLSMQSPTTSYVFDLGDAVRSRRAATLTTPFDLLDPGQLTLAQLNIRAVESRDTDATLRFDAERPLGHSLGRDGSAMGASRLGLGVQLSRRTRDYDRRDRRAVLRDGAGDLAGLFSGATPDNVFSDLITVRPWPWIRTDFDRVRAAFELAASPYDIVFRPGEAEASGADRQNAYGVIEEVAAAYVRLDLEGEVAALSMSGNLGLRAVQTSTEVQGARMVLAGPSAEVRQVRFEDDHRILLPSLNVAVDLTPNAILRLAASTSMTRPSLADLRASTVPASVLVSAIYRDGTQALTDPEPGLIFSGVGGNPALRPYVSTNLDLSYEMTGRRTSVSAAYFHKSIEDFIETVEAVEQVVFETQSGQPVVAAIPIARPQNVGRAIVDGVELGLHHRIAAGLGLWASATWTQSRLRGGGRLTGVSDWSWSLSPYVERGPLAVHLSWSWRSPFRSEADLQGGGVSDFTVAAAGYLDAQAVYRLPLGGEFVVSGSNLTNVRDLAYDGARSRLLQIGSVGRQASVGLRWTW